MEILEHKGKKALVRHLETGRVGNNSEGYKWVESGDTDIVLIRHCHYNRKEAK